MYFELLQLIQKYQTKIRFIKNTSTKCGKLYIHMELYKKIYEFLQNSKFIYRTNMITSICSHYNLITGDIAVIYDEDKEFILFMYIKTKNGKNLVSCPSYSIEPSIAVFTNNIQYSDKYPLCYWDL